MRFLDLARGLPVTDRLIVTTWAAGAREPKFTATRSPLSGVYGFRSLPGLRPFEQNEQPALDWCSSPPNGISISPDALHDLNTLRDLITAGAGGPAPNFVISVVDQLERFLPQVLLMCLPKEKLIEVPLFSAPARPVTPGMAVVRGELWEAANERPASWAFITASPEPATTYVAVADERGMFTLTLPYANSLPPLVGSPPHGSTPIDQLTWPLTVQVFYQPMHQRFVSGLDPPDIRSILEQDAAQLHDTPGSPAATLMRSLRFGEPLTLATQGRSRLLIDPV